MLCVALTSGITRKAMNSLTSSSSPTLLQKINSPSQTTLFIQGTGAGPVYLE